MGSNDVKRPLWGVIGVTMLLALAGPYLLLNTFLENNPKRQRALMAGDLSSATPVPKGASAERLSPITTVTVLATSTPTPTPMAPGSNFEGAYVSGVTWLQNGDTMVRVVVPEGAAGEYRAEITTLPPRKYVCLIPKGYEDRIYCIGPHLARGTMVTIQVYHHASLERLVFVSEFLVTEVLPTPTATPTSGAEGFTSVTGSGTPSLTPAISPSSSGTHTPTPSGSQTPTPMSSPSATPLPTSTLLGSTPTATALASSATPASTSSTPVPTQTPSAPTATQAPTDELPEKCKGADHPVFPCTQTPAPAPTVPPTSAPAPTDPPTSSPEPTQEPAPTP